MEEKKIRDDRATVTRLRSDLEIEEIKKQARIQGIREGFDAAREREPDQYGANALGNLDVRSGSLKHVRVDDYLKSKGLV